MTRIEGALLVADAMSVLTLVVLLTVITLTLTGCDAPPRIGAWHTVTLLK
jgi:hypothetical protein